MRNDMTPEDRIIADLPAGEADRPCGWCQRAPGLLLVVTGALLAYIGTDILTGGWLTRVIAGPAAAAAASTATSAAATAVTVAGEVVTGGTGQP